MKTALIICGLLAAAFTTAFSPGTKGRIYADKPAATMKNTTAASFYELSISALDGKKTISFSDFKGKKVLCVNTASKCGYTSQYEGLEKLHKRFGDKLVVIGFPCNQFGGQEPGGAEEISGFCEKNYGVTFLLTEKTDVKGSKAHPVYQWLTQKSKNGKADYTIRWNFNKFLIDENGQIMEHFGSGVTPDSKELISLIES
jgi:glutathione peroxidase